jgi:hypothetical protein
VVAGYRQRRVRQNGGGEPDRLTESVGELRPGWRKRRPVYFSQ